MNYTPASGSPQPRAGRAATPYLDTHFYPPLPIPETLPVFVLYPELKVYPFFPNTPTLKRLPDLESPYGRAQAFQAYDNGLGQSLSHLSQPHSHLVSQHQVAHIDTHTHTQGPREPLLSFQTQFQLPSSQMPVQAQFQQASPVSLAGVAQKPTEGQTRCLTPEVVPVSMDTLLDMHFPPLSKSPFSSSQRYAGVPEPVGLGLELGKEPYLLDDPFSSQVSVDDTQLLSFLEMDTPKRKSRSLPGRRKPVAPSPKLLRKCSSFSAPLSAPFSMEECSSEFHVAEGNYLFQDETAELVQLSKKKKRRPVLKKAKTMLNLCACLPKVLKNMELGLVLFQVQLKGIPGESYMNE